MKQRMIQYETNRHSSGGFTLVEMLVSVALVLLMMTMFATVFQIATNSVSDQQANGENDQKARALETVIRNDFGKRTHRNPQPFVLGETPASSTTSFGDRRGYIYISTNNPTSFSDDLIQFTVDVDQVSEVTDGTLYFGRATPLVDPITGVALLTANWNQPDGDDGNPSANATASSTTAEVTYFIRQGNLYRRQLLVRKALATSENTQPTSASPNLHDFFAGYSDDTDDDAKAATFTGDFRLPGPTVYASPGPPPTFSTADDVLTDDFYTYFDFSAFPQTATYGSSSPITVITAQFIGVEALNNDGTTGGGALVALAKPRYRFGFDFSDGLSREHLQLIDPSDRSSAAIGFMGRPLHAETSMPNFNWPQQPATTEAGAALPGSGNPFDIDLYDYTLNSNGVIDAYDGPTGRGGPRRQEDLIMSNVHEMRIEVFDERLGRYVVPGHGTYDPTGPTLTGLNGDFHIARNLNTAYGPDNRITGAVFDTWHPDNFSTPQAGQRAPYELYLFTPPHVADDGTTPAGVPLEAQNLGWYEASPSGNYTLGDVVFPFDDNNTNGTYDAGTDTGVTGREFHVAYRCIGSLDGTTGDGDGDTETAVQLGGPPPDTSLWTTTPGRRITDGEVVWEAVDNTKSLKSIRMTIRFRNEKSGKMRQLTMVLPLTDDS